MVVIRNLICEYRCISTPVNNGSDAAVVLLSISEGGKIFCSVKIDMKGGRENTESFAKTIWHFLTALGYRLYHLAICFME